MAKKTESNLPPVSQASADVEQENLRYTGNRIPWYVRLIWIGFWIFVVYYTITFLFPSLQLELLPDK